VAIRVKTLRNRECRLPGEDLAEQGLADLARGVLSECSLLVLVAGPRLRRLGIEVSEVPIPEPYGHALYSLIEERLDAGAHSYYK